ncbi:MAG TPA: DUF1461 domain-containing protein [Coriobacteriia bacterium]|nr:DUF1461 domain-containing protein [Coriobacteriia bacterium]
MRRAEALVAALVLAVLAVGLALVPLELPWFTRVLAERYSELPSGISLPLAEASRRFVIVSDTAAQDVLARFMTADAISHLEDVQGVILAANIATSLMALLAVTWMVLRRSDTRLIARALAGAAVGIGAFLLLAVGVALIDFDSFFSAFHGIFFAEGTWTFPSDSVLIRLFPESFWTIAGVTWAALIGVIALGYGIASWVLGKRVSDVHGR